MEEAKAEIIAQFGHKLRLRVSGICLVDDKILLVKHLNLGAGKYLWAPPGGGLHFGETTQDCLIREFKEETGLLIEVKKFLFVNEFLAPPLHAIELFFEVKIISGELRVGNDPEMSPQGQIIQSVEFLDWKKISEENPVQIHSIFRKIEKLSDILQLKEYHLNQS
jgi:8-oxo-dGTP diphosphatase